MKNMIMLRSYRLHSTYTAHHLTSHQSINQIKLSLWELEFTRQTTRLQDVSDSKFKEISLNDQIVPFQHPIRPIDVLKQQTIIKPKDVLYCKVNHDLVQDLYKPLTQSCKLEFIPFHESKMDMEILGQSAAFLFGLALEKTFGKDVLMSDQPYLTEQGGFYYDFLLKRGVADSSQDHDSVQKLYNDKSDLFHLKNMDLQELKKLCKKLASKDLLIHGLQVPLQVAKDMFFYSPFKTAMLSQWNPAVPVNVYKCDEFIDICQGPLVSRTSQMKGFELLESGGSLWNKQYPLNRVYGIAFPNTSFLDSWKSKALEASNRDHRVIGKKQKLFMMHPLSPGCAFILPHGTRIVNKLLDTLKKEYQHFEFQEVSTPMLYNKSLWQQSGHWDNYKEDMFLIEEEGGQDKMGDGQESVDIGLKPMNCPGHCLLFSHESRSYKDLPLRLADFSSLHRNEASGALTGLTRVRQFHQDDGHIFCRMNQIQEEITSCLDFLVKIYKKLDFQSYSFVLSTRPEKYLGDKEDWDAAEQSLKKVLDQKQVQWNLNEGDGAFYGPKIDIHVKDAIGRRHQTATIQLDFQLPCRFDLKYANESGAFERPVIIHRAILGSVERMLAILMEHTGGKWPLWLSPRQAMVIPTRPALNEYALGVKQKLVTCGYYADVDVSDNTMNKKIKDAQELHYNYILIAGDREKESNTITIRSREEPYNLKEVSLHSMDGFNLSSF